MLLSSGCSAQHGTAPIWVAPSCGLHSAPAQHILRAPETAKVRIKPGGRASGPVGVQALLPTPQLQLAAPADPASLNRAPHSSLHALASDRRRCPVLPLELRTKVGLLASSGGTQPFTKAMGRL